MNHLSRYINNIDAICQIALTFQIFSMYSQNSDDPLIENPPVKPLKKKCNCTLKTHKILASLRYFGSLNKRNQENCFAFLLATR